MKKYYVTNLYGIDKDFKIDNKDVNYCIGKASKKDYGTIIVKKWFDGYREIVTGKKFLECVILHKYFNHYYYQNSEIIVPNKPLFVLVENHEVYDINNSSSIRRATLEEVDNYLKEYKNRKVELLDYFNKIENLTNNYLDNAKLNYNRINKLLLKK